MNLTGLLPIKPDRYIIAVSGGVDSVVLLDLLSGQANLELVVAHFDHGIREDSQRDCKFVANLAKSYDLPFVTEEGRLGKSASEATAREARYRFLRKVKDQEKAKAILTAHHRDDVIETLIINLLRGTHRRGLSSLDSNKEVIRPLLNVPKNEVIKYAKSSGLKWREDPTNTDTEYLRNYIRHTLLPKMRKQNPDIEQELFKMSQSMRVSNQALDNELARLTETQATISASTISWPRAWFVMLPENVATEVIYDSLKRLKSDRDISRSKLKQAAMFAKIGKLNKQLPISKTAELKISKNLVNIHKI